MAEAMTQEKYHLLPSQVERWREKLGQDFIDERCVILDPRTPLQRMQDQAKADQKAHNSKWGKGPSSKNVAAVKAASKSRSGVTTAALKVKIADLVGQGLSDREIARRLRRSKDTVYYHSKPIREAIDARRRKSE